MGLKKTRQLSDRTSWPVGREIRFRGWSLFTIRGHVLAGGPVLLVATFVATPVGVIDSMSPEDAACHIHVAAPPGEPCRHVAEGVRPGALLSFSVSSFAIMWIGWVCSSASMSVHVFLTASPSRSIWINSFHVSSRSCRCDFDCHAVMSPTTSFPCTEAQMTSLEINGSSF